MNIPEIVVEWALGIASATGVGGFLFLKGRSKDNFNKIEKLKDRMSIECDIMDKKILDAIEKLGEQMTPITHCNAKQELWQERFDMWMKQNKEQHDHIGENVGMALAGIEKQLGVVFDKIDTMQECLNKIQAKKAC